MRRLIIKPSFDRDWNRLSIRVQDKLRDQVFVLCEMTLPSRERDIVKLTGITPTTFRLRIGDYRAIFQYDAQTVTLINIGHRKDIYR